jgi:hypothetical protein
MIKIIPTGFKQFFPLPQPVGIDHATKFSPDLPALCTFGRLL